MERQISKEKGQCSHQREMLEMRKMMTRLLGIINMTVGGLESVKDERKRRKRVCGEANIMMVKPLSQHLITFELETDNKISTPHF